MDKPINIKVEFGCTPIENIAIQCPNCNKWFFTEDITSDGECICYNYEISKHKECICPICETEFNLNNVLIDETDSSKINKICVRKKITWE